MTAAASISNRKSSSSAAAMRGKDSLTFVLHPKQLVAFRSKATETLYGSANREKRPLLSWSGWRHLRGRPTPRFRTIQVCPKDLPAALRQAGGAEDRAHGSVGGADTA